MTVSLCVCTAAVLPFQCDPHPNGSAHNECVSCRSSVTMGRSERSTESHGGDGLCVESGSSEIPLSGRVGHAFLAQASEQGRHDVSAHLRLLFFSTYARKPIGICSSSSSVTWPWRWVPVLAKGSTELFSFCAVELCRRSLGLCTRPITWMSLFIWRSLAFLAALQTRMR